jgi:hypothetical protein
MRTTARSMLERMAPKERASFTPDRLRDIRNEFARLSACWSVLRIGESFSESW